MRFFTGDSGLQPFVLVADDGITPLDLTGFTVTWVFTNRDGTTPGSTPITGNITAATSGEVEFDLPSSLTTAKTHYTTTIKAVSGTKTTSSVGVIIVDVDSR